MESPEYSGMSCAVEVGKVYTCLRLDQYEKAVVLSVVIQIEIIEDSCSENESGNSKLMEAAKMHCESEKITGHVGLYSTVPSQTVILCTFYHKQQSKKTSWMLCNFSKKDSGREACHVKHGESNWDFGFPEANMRGFVNFQRHM